MKRRFLSTLMALVLALSLVPTAAFAAEGETVSNVGTEETTEQMGVVSYGQYILGKPANGLGNRAIYQPAAP